MGAISTLTDRQEAFITAYLGPANLNATEAARMAGYAHPNVAAWHDLLVNPSIRNRIRGALEAKGMCVEEVLARLSDCARASLDDVIDVDSDDPSIWRLNLNKAKRRGVLHTVASVKATKYGPEVRMHDPLEALSILARVHKMMGSDPSSETVRTQVNPEQADQRISEIMRAGTLRMVETGRVRIEGCQVVFVEEKSIEAEFVEIEE